MSKTLPYGVTFTVELALSAATGSYGTWDSGLWNTATWGPDIVWADVSDRVRSLTISRRFSRDLQAWEPGTATIVLNDQDGRFDPNNLSGPYVTGGITQIRPWRPARIRFAYNGITYDAYAGYGIDWQEDWLESSPGKGHAITTVQCVDELAALAEFDGLEMSPVGAGETSGRRVHRILDNAGHTGLRDVAEGRATLQATTLAANAVTELKLVADSEGGALFVGRDGAVVFEDIFALIENSRSNTVQATFGDGGGAELGYGDVAGAYNGDLIANIAAFARVGGTAQIATDETSRALYRDKRYSRTDLICETDTQVQALANIWVQRYKDPESRFTQLRIKPRFDPTRLFPQVLGREVRDLLRVVKRPPGGHTVTQDVYVAGITHTVTGDDWVTDLDLWSGRPYTSFTASRWDVGTWDSALWFY